MADHAMNPLQVKIFEILDGDANLTTTLGATIYDNIPDNSAYPAVQIGNSTFDDFGSHDIDGFDVDLEIHVWSQAQGAKECKDIMSRIYTLLHNVDLNITGHKTVSLRGGFAQSTLDPDGRTNHGVIRFNLILGG